MTADGIRRLGQARPDLRIIGNTDDAALRQIASQFRPRRTRILRSAASCPVVLRLRARGPDVTDAGVAALRGMTHIEDLDLTDARVTDGSIDDPATLSGMKRLDLGGTQITASGASKLQQALPDCTISR